MKRTLGLRREALVELSSGDLGAVVGGDYSGGQGLSCPVLRCLNTDTLYSLPHCQPDSIVCE